MNTNRMGIEKVQIRWKLDIIIKEKLFEMKSNCHVFVYFCVVSVKMNSVLLIEKK